jgi:hypothetical protein
MAEGDSDPFTRMRSDPHARSLGESRLSVNKQTNLHRVIARTAGLRVTTTQCPLL